jgi:hypothetical protein
MKRTSLRLLSLLLAAILQLTPMIRTFLIDAQGLAPSSFSFILKIGVGAAALLGFDAVSRASSIAISPPNATVGVPYIGTITYSGGHAGSVSSMSFSNNCIGASATFLDGLNIVYNGGNTATVSGTPTGAGTFSFSIKVFDRSGCGSNGNSDNRSTALVVGAGGGGPVAPSISVIPPNTCAQVGSDVQLSGGASGNPTPQYQWWSGLTPIPNATNSILTIPNVQLTNAGVYTLTASNSQNVGFLFGALPKANCYLSVAISGGTNFSAFLYTNFATAGVPLTMYSYFTNVPTAINHYLWTYNGVNVVSTSNTVVLPGAALTPAKSGTYTVTFNSTNGGGQIISGQNYDSYWAFGYPPAFTNSLPAATNLSAGASTTLSIPIRGSLNVYNGAGGAGGYSTNAIDPCVFWYKDGNLVAAQTYALGPTSLTTYSNTAVNATLTLNNVSSANSGTYTVVATNFWGTTTSSPIVLTVGSGGNPPAINANPPASVSRLAGQSSSLAVGASGTAPLTYQWYKDGASLTANATYGGVQTSTLTLTSVTTSNSGNYKVAVNNSFGSVTSSVTALSVSLPPVVIPNAGLPGVVGFNANTVTGLTYIVESTTNLAAPIWTPVLTNNSGLSGTINFQTNFTTSPSMYFRILFP